MAYVRKASLLRSYGVLQIITRYTPPFSGKSWETRFSGWDLGDIVAPPCHSESPDVTDGG